MSQTLQKGKKIYFVSDAHLGLPPRMKSLDREKRLVRWLDEVRTDAQAIYLLGDIFDYWFEYKKVVPRGFVRFLGKIAEITDSGIPVYYFTGNHDVWVFDYLPGETGVTVYHEAQKIEINGLKFYLAHGDGLGPSQWSYKMLKAIFTNRMLQWLYARIHPNSATGFAHRWSKHSRFSKGEDAGFLGEDKEYLIRHSRKILTGSHFDFFIYGHRHLPLDFNLGKSRVIYLGDWFANFTYAVFDGKEVSLMKYNGK